jgi:hypothetical protein
VSQFPSVIVTNVTPDSTSRLASRQLMPKGVSPNGFANAGDSLLTSKALRAALLVMIAWACSVKRSRPVRSWLFD